MHTPLLLLQEFSNWPTYPQLYINGELVGGCDIVLELAETGELQVRRVARQPGCASSRLAAVCSYPANSKAAPRRCAERAQ